MRAGRVDEAGAMAGRIRAVITRNSAKRLQKVDTKKSPKYAWEKVREVTRSTAKSCTLIQGLTAQDMNDHYAVISTDGQHL